MGIQERCNMCQSYKEDCDDYISLDGTESIKICKDCIRKGLIKG